MGQSIAKARVIKAWRASYDPALAVRAGDTVTPGREDTEYPGWVWCIDRHGLGGWLPVEILNGAKILFDFNAMEASVAQGAVVEILEERHDWARVQGAGGVEGWLPLNNLAR